MKQYNNEVRNSTENPCNMCMPMGAIIPFKGLEKTMVIIHGSQGCATYMRRHMAEHFNEPIDIASSSITEEGTIYGGEANLIKGLENLLNLYKPEAIGILTTCLSETIGEDVKRIAALFKERRGEQPCPRLIPVNTPGYGGSHSEGYFKALCSIVETLATDERKHEGINVIVPHISPADTREIKRILELMNIQYTLLPDISDTLDGPYTKVYKRIPDGGTPLVDIKTMAGARATIQFGQTVDDELSPGKYLQTEYGVPFYNLPLPMGITACDRFVKILHKITGQDIPTVLIKERGRLQDAMIDSHKYNREGRALVFGEPETVYAVSRLLTENGITPVMLATGSKSPRLQKLVEKLAQEESIKEPLLLLDSDFNQIRNQCTGRLVNLAIGSSDGKILEEKEYIPLVRLGFPIHDRIGGQRVFSLGYTGSIALLDEITNTLFKSKLSNYREDLYQRYYSPLKAGNI